MGHPFGNPLYRYGIAFSNAAILAFVALMYLEDTTRWLVLGLAIVEMVLTPYILERVAEQAEDTQSDTG